MTTKAKELYDLCKRKTEKKFWKVLALPIILMLTMLLGVGICFTITVKSNI